MSKLPGNAGVSLLGDKSLEFYRDPASFCQQRIEKHRSRIGQPESVYTVFKSLGTELVLGLFLNVRAEEQPELFQEISQLCTQHWHGLISAPVNVKVPMWSSGFSIALDARNKLMDIIKDKLENDKEGFVGSLGSLPLPDSSSAAQHLLLFISALIPKALASLLTSFTLALGGNEQEEARRQATEDPDYLRRVLLEVRRLWPPFIGGRRIADQDSTLMGFHVPKDFGVIYISHAVHRDPEVFQEPDAFLPERWSGSHPKRQLSPIRNLWDVRDKQIRSTEAPPRSLQDCKGSVANILVPDSTAHSQGSGGVHALMGQGFFESGTNTRNEGHEHFLCSFGNGPRSCIGAKLTNVFLKEACVYLLNNFDWCLDPPVQNLEYKWLPVSRPANPPTVTFTQRDHTLIWQK
ncbi:ankyrin repeat and SOCS box protein 12 [Sarotherodon galilaeus]